MKKTIKSLLLLTALASASGLQAEDVKVLNVVAKDADGKVIAEAPVSLESGLHFTDTGMEVVDNGMLQAVFNYTDMTAFAFQLSTVTGISNVAADTALGLRQNPVANALGITGFTKEEAALRVTDLKGEIKVSLPAWQGEDVDVSALTPGLYFVTINQTTLKFIKK